MKINFNLTESRYLKHAFNEDLGTINTGVKKDIEQELFIALTYFDKLYNHLSSRKLIGLEEEEPYHDFMERFYSSSYLPNNTNDSDVSFIYDGNIVFSKQMALAGKIFFNELYEIYKSDLEITPKVIDETWDYTKELCKPEIENNDLYYINNHYKDFLNLTEKIIPALEQVQETSSNDSFDFSSLPHYPVYSSIQEPVEVNDETNPEQYPNTSNENEYDFYYTDDEKQPNKWIKKTVINILTNPITLAIKVAGSLIALLLN